MFPESAVIKYGFQDYKEFFDSKADNNKHVATCKFCRKKKITEKLGRLRHLLAT